MILPKRMMNSIDVINLSSHSYENAVTLMNNYLQHRRPLVFRGLDIGKCSEKWQLNEYLYQNDPDKMVSVHVANRMEMDFKNKNFEYRNMKMADFINICASDSNEHWYYLRTLGNDVRKDRSNFSHQYPDLASDLVIPPVFTTEKFFSSVFRMSSKNCRLWTHYDTMDNILIQVRGEKTIIFYSPFDAEYLYIDGDKSPILCPEEYDLVNYPLLEKATPFVANMLPGDIVFIPALWFHNVRSCDFSIAVNVFWYHLQEELYDKKDVYGNKDPLPVVRVNQSLDNAMKVMMELPEEYRHIYGLNLVKKISAKLLKRT